MATRDLTSGMKAELIAGRVQPIILYEGVFVGFTMRLWTGIGDLSWNSLSWLGNGWLHSIEGIDEDSDIGASGMSITLAGVPRDLISTMLGYAQHGASGKLWLGFLDSSSAVIADPYLMFKGKLDVPTIDDRVTGPIIQVTYDSAISDNDEAKEYRYTPESQHIFTPGDKGFNYVAKLASRWEGQWGQTPKQIKKKQARLEKKKKEKDGK